jgi:hypothetical protein
MPKNDFGRNEMNIRKYLECIYDTFDVLKPEKF